MPMFIVKKLNDFKQLLLVVTAFPIWLVSFMTQHFYGVSAEVKEDDVKLKLKGSPRTISRAANKNQTWHDESKVSKGTKEADECLVKAFRVKDYQMVMQLWNTQHSSEQAATIKLSQIVEAMKFCKKDSVFIVSQLKAFLQAHPTKQDMSIINELLKSLGLQLDSHLVDVIVAMLPSVNLLKDKHTFEVMLTMHVAKRNFVKVQRLLEEMGAMAIQATTQTTVAIMTMALQKNDFNETFRTFLELKDKWDDRSTWGVSVWTVEKHKTQVMAQLVELACKTQHLGRLVPKLAGMQINEDAVNMMLAQCGSTNDLQSAKLVEAIARANQAPLKDSTCTLLIKCLASRPWRARAVVKEMLWRDSPPSEELGTTLLEFCCNSSDKAMADRLFQQMQPKSWNVLAAFVRFYTISGNVEEALDILERHLPSFNGKYLKHPLTGLIDTSTGMRAMVGALQCGRTSLAQHLFETAASSTEKHVVAIQKWWRRGYANKCNAKPVSLDAVLAVGSRMSQIFQDASLDLDEGVSLALMFEPVKASKSRPRRSSSPDGSTSAGTMSDSDGDSADEWMTKAAWRAPPGLEHLLDPLAPFPDLPDLWVNGVC
jgi:hypothetical protein